MDMRWPSALAWATGILLLIYLSSVFWHGNVKPGDLAALSSPAEVGTGLCAAYLGFDRFRYHNRFKALARQIMKMYGAGPSMIEQSLRDGSLTNDEKNLLHLLRLCGDEAGKAWFDQHRQILEDNQFAKSVEGRRLKWLLVKYRDRRIVIILLTTLCGWLLLSASLQVMPETWTKVMPSRWVLLPAATLVLAAFVAPAAGFLYSEATFRRVSISAGSWGDSISNMLNRMAGSVPAPVPPTKPKPQTRKAPSSPAARGK